jgi:hypothetical protein
MEITRQNAIDQNKRSEKQRKQTATKGCEPLALYGKHIYGNRMRDTFFDVDGNLFRFSPHRYQRCVYFTLL